MTPEARAALSRRGFLKASGVMIVSFAAADEAVRAQALPGPAPGGPAMNRLDSWIAIMADGSVTAYSGKEEIGQGISTAQQQLVAEELSVPFERVKLIYCDTALTPDQAHTSGSQSHAANFNHGNLALAGATARAALLRMAAEKLAIPFEQLSAENGVVFAAGDRTKRVSYGELVQGRRFNLTLEANAKRKPASEWTVLGKPIPRPDLPELMTGRFEFVHNVRVPGMVHGRVVRPPAPGATVLSVDEGSVKGMAGLLKVVVRKNFVGVVAEKPWQAMQAAAKLKVAWSAATPLPNQANFYDYLRNTKPTRDSITVDSKDTAAKLAGAATVLKATYLHPYQMHGSMGSSCAVADVQGDKATIWSPTQGVWYQKNTCSMLLGIKPENVRVIFRRGSGCYGINGADTVTYDAAILSQAVGKPVRVQLSRKDEMAWENYGNPYVMDERAGLDAAGNIVAWEHESWSAGRGGRPGFALPGNIVTGGLVGFEPEPFVPRSPAPAPASYNNGSNAVPSYLTGSVNGKAGGTGNVGSERVVTHTIPSPFYTGPLRSPARLQNTFAHESFMDEIAAHLKQDPVAYRLKHLRDPRLMEVLKASAGKADWEARPSPRTAAVKNGVTSGRGIACVEYEGDNGYTSLVAEVEVALATGIVTVKRIVVAMDVGPISNPDGLKNQAEGGALQGMSRALGEEVTWDAAQITSVDWRTYKTLPLGFAIPEIECVLINRPEEEANGAGETSITVAAAAIANAIFDATGARIREVPFTAARVKAAMAKGQVSE